MSDNECLKLFEEWQSLSERIRHLGAIVQNPIEDVSYENYKENWKISQELRAELNNLNGNTLQFIWNNCSSRWEENGELD